MYTWSRSICSFIYLLESPVWSLKSCRHLTSLWLPFVRSPLGPPSCIAGPEEVCKSGPCVHVHPGYRRKHKVGLMSSRIIMISAQYICETFACEDWQPPWASTNPARSWANSRCWPFQHLQFLTVPTWVGPYHPPTSLIPRACSLHSRHRGPLSVSPSTSPLQVFVLAPSSAWPTLPIDPGATGCFW